MDGYKRRTIAGDCIVLGASTKPDKRGNPDYKRYDRGYIEDYIRGEGVQNVEILDPGQEGLVHQATVDMSGTKFREALIQRNHQALREFIPEESLHRIDDILNILDIPSELSETKKKGDFSSVLYGLIEEVLNEQTEPFQINVKAKHPKAKKDYLTTGPNKETGGGGGHTKPSMDRAKSAPPLGEENEIVEILEDPDIWAGERRLDPEELDQWAKEAKRIWREAEGNVEKEEHKNLMRIFDDKKFEQELKNYNLSTPEAGNIRQGRTGFIWLNKYGISTGYSTVTGELLGSPEHIEKMKYLLQKGHEDDLAAMKAKKAREADTRQLEEASNPNAIGFVAGEKNDLQACCDDPNCRELKNPDCGELEEISMVGGAGLGLSGDVEGYSGPKKRGSKKKKKQPSLIRREQLINDIINYLLENGS